MAIREKGSKYQVDVTVKGVRAPRVSCDTRAEATKIEAQFKAHLLAGGDPADLSTSGTVQRTSTATLGSLLDATYKDRWQGAKAEESSLRNGSAWCDALGYDYPITKLGPQVVSEVCDKWAVNGNKAGTINRKLAALSVLLGVAVDRGLLEKKFRLPRKKEYEGRLRFYSDAEVDSLIDHVEGDAPLRNLFIVAVETGMRQSEILGLTKRDVDLQRGLALLGETKGNKRRSVPLTQRAQQALQSMITQHMRDHDLLFPASISARSISRVIAMWKGMMGLPKDDEACFHTFRHTTCSRLVQRGVPIIVIQKWMGHATIQTTMRYAHLAPDSLDVALAALEGG